MPVRRRVSRDPPLFLFCPVADICLRRLGSASASSQPAASLTPPVFPSLLLSATPVPTASTKFMIITGDSCRPIRVCVPLLRGRGDGGQVDSGGGRSDGAGGEDVSSDGCVCRSDRGINKKEQRCGNLRSFLFRINVNDIICRGARQKRLTFCDHEHGEKPIRGGRSLLPFSHGSRACLHDDGCVAEMFFSSYAYLLFVIISVSETAAVSLAMMPVEA